MVSRGDFIVSCPRAMVLQRVRDVPSAPRGASPRVLGGGWVQVGCSGHTYPEHCSALGSGVRITPASSSGVAGVKLDHQRLDTLSPLGGHGQARADSSQICHLWVTGSSSKPSAEGKRGPAEHVVPSRLAVPQPR